METGICHNIVIYNSQLIEKSDINFDNFNDGTVVYEIIRVINGIPLFLEDHVMRLYYSANIAGFSIGISDSEISNSIRQLSTENQCLNGNIKVLFHYKKNQKVSFICYFTKHNYPSVLQYKNGVEVLLYSAERDNPNAKIANDDFRETLDDIIIKEKVYELLLVNKNGWITEGSKSNVFFIKDNLLITAPIRMVLPGITRKFVIKAARLSGLEISEDCVNKKNIGQYNAAFISGTSPQILPISSINNIRFDVNNSIIRKLMNSYEEEVENYIYDFS
ncbi:MAG: aminotransferase class IV [Bacteroidetes bacterium]|nr:aminotransferase class IV [Bacteroidota bacterium]